MRQAEPVEQLRGASLADRGRQMVQRGEILQVLPAG